MERGRKVVSLVYSRQGTVDGYSGPVRDAQPVNQLQVAPGLRPGVLGGTARTETRTVKFRGDDDVIGKLMHEAQYSVCDSETSVLTAKRRDRQKIETKERETDVKRERDGTKKERRC